MDNSYHPLNSNQLDIQPDQESWKVGDDMKGFFLSGLINNVTYVIFLSAAQDLVGSSLPKAIVLMADILPAFLIKLLIPYIMHHIPYSYRVTLVCLSSTLSLLIVGTSTTQSIQLFGIGLASAGSGLGEVSYLALASYYQSKVISAFSSGTGAAGLIGAFLYLVMTTALNLSVSTTLILCSLIPLLQLFVYFKLLNQPGLVINDIILTPNSPILPPILNFRDRINLILSLIPIYMIPLFLVFLIEYTIMSGLTPNLLFPLNELPFPKLSYLYIYYQLFYQFGVFLSRSSATHYPINHLYLIAIIQLFISMLLLLQSLLMIPSTWYLTFIYIFSVGLMGGCCYANAFRRINKEIQPLNRGEFAMGAASVADTLGIASASILAYWIEPTICNYQVAHQIILCKQV